jgi:hypothetical protein
VNHGGARHDQRADLRYFGAFAGRDPVVDEKVRAMRMTASERKLCPDLYRYLRYSMPKCAHISLIVNNLVAYGGMTVTQARHALHWGTDPFVFVYEPRNRRCINMAGHAKCCFNPDTPNDIDINPKDYAEFFLGKGMGYTATGLRVPIVGVALLHALCHWGNYNNGITEASDEGFRFEQATYGRVIG